MICRAHEMTLLPLKTPFHITTRTGSQPHQFRFLVNSKKSDYQGKEKKKGSFNIFVTIHLIILCVL